MSDVIEDLEEAGHKHGSPPPQRRSRAKVRVALAAAALVVLLAAASAFDYYRYRVSTDDAQVDAHIVPIAARISGSVAEVLVNDNQPVKAGQVLVRIDPRDYQAKVDQARAALALAESQARAAQVSVPWTRETTASGTSGAEAHLAAAEADYARSKASYEQAAGSDLAYARADVASHEARNKRAQADLERMRPLVEKAEISRQQFDAYAATAQVEESDLQAAREQLGTAQKEVEIRRAAMLQNQAKIEQARAGLTESRANSRQVDIRGAQAASAVAGIAQARANLEAADLSLSYTTLTAPTDGVVTKKSVEVGQIIQPGQDLLAVIPLHDVWVTANFKETQLANVRVGQKVEVKVDSYGKTFTGHVDSIAGATGARLSLLPPENATGNYVKVVQRIPVKIVLDPGQGDAPAGQAPLRVGMNADATIVTK